MIEARPESAQAAALQASQVASALESICHAEHVTMPEIRSIRFVDDEIVVEIARLDGRRRTSTYPLRSLSRLTL